jgi:lysophospholipase L1-like esterase
MSFLIAIAGNKKPGGSPPPPPDLPSGATLRVMASTGTAANANGTGPANTTNADISYWQDLSGNNNHLLRVSSDPRPTYQDENGVPVVQFNSNGRLSATSSANVTAMSVHALVRRTSTPGDNPIMSFGSSYGTPFLADCWSSAGGVSAFDINSSGIGSPAALDPFDTWHVLSFCYDGASAQISAYVDGGLISPNSGISSPAAASAVANFTQSAFGLGFWAPGGSSVRARIAEVAVYRGTCHNAATVQSVVDYFRSAYPALYGGSGNLTVWATNSIGTALYTSGAAGSLPSLTRSGASKPWSTYAMSRSGSTSPSLTSRVSQDVGVPLAKWGGLTVAVVLEGRNDVVTNGANATVAYNNLVALSTALKGNGADSVVMCTVLPSTGLADATRDSLNTLIRGDVTWTVADIAADPTIGGNSSNSNTTIYGDGVHLNATGTAIAAPIIRAAIESVLP